MPNLAGEKFELRLVRTADILLHEEYEDDRSSRLVKRFRTEKVLYNPLILGRHRNRYILIDGANRFEALKRISCKLVGSNCRLFESLSYNQVLVSFCQLSFYGYAEKISKKEQALVDPHYAVPHYAVLTFVLPLAAALVFGRVFCSGVCPLGAIQELVTLRAVTVPPKLDRALGALKWAYLAVALYYAVLPAVERDFLICRFDPFVGLFRFTGAAWLLMTGGAFLVEGVFVGRPYCRWLCPYGALPSASPRYAWRSFSLTPDRQLDCGLCQSACPYGAIADRRAIRTACFAHALPPRTPRRGRDRRRHRRSAVRGLAAGREPAPDRGGAPARAGLEAVGGLSAYWCMKA